MLVPLGSRVILEPVKLEQKEVGGFVVDESLFKAPQSIRCSVVAVGEDASVVKVGDVVLVSQFGPTEAKENPLDKTLVCAEEDILAVVKS